MLRIGFIDHHLNNYHANKFLALLRGPLAERGAEVSLAWESDPIGDDWCAANDVPRAASAEAVAEAADLLFVLAPDNIDAHLDLCRRVFPTGKPALVDKFLATTRREAEEIVSLAERHRNRLFSGSALRFAVETEAALAEIQEPITDAFARGMGKWEGYGVHTLALVMSGMGHDVRRLVDTGTGDSASVTLEYVDGRRAWVDVRASANQWEALPWVYGYRAGERYAAGQIADFDGFYHNMLKHGLDALIDGRQTVSTAEMVATAAILEAATESRARGGEWITL